MRTPLITAALLLCGASGIAPVPVRGQTLTEELTAVSVVRAGQPPVVRDLGVADVHRYVLTLGAGQVVWGTADQQSVDVVVRVVDPAGRVLGTFDGPARGPEQFRFVTSAAGPHRIEITPFERNSGRYALVVERTAPLARTPVGVVDQLLYRHDRRDAPGAVVAVMRAGRLVFTKAYGMANLEHGIPNGAGTVFHVASVSKQFTAFAVARLAEEGRLSLDDDVRRHLPELPDLGAGRSSPVTLRHLLNHTSGLNDQWALWGMAGGRLDDVITQDNLLELVWRQRALEFSPGTEHRYSNTNYMLLAEVVARVTGEPFGAYLQRTVFAPLGMSATQVYDDHQRLVPRRADSYERGPGNYRRLVLNFANYGATSLLTTAEDLVRWLSNFGTGRVGGRAVLRRMQERGVLAGGDTIRYALGISIDEHRGLRRVEHSGSDAGYRAVVAYYPELDAGVVVLGNDAGLDAGNVARDVAEAFFGDRMQPAPAPALLSAAIAPAPRPAASWRPAVAELAQYAGRYYSPELETVYTVFVEGDSLVARHRRHGRLPLAAADARDEFRSNAWYFGHVRFERGSDGRITGLRASGGRVRDLWFERQP